jgi:hypothetical protein
MSEGIAEQTAPYEYVKDPIIINTERPRLSRPNRISHRLRVPTLEQWLVWGHEVYEERRYLTKQEWEEQNRFLGREEPEEPEEPVEYAYESHFNEYDASRRLYKAIAIDVTAYESNEHEELEPVETHPITEELLQKAILSPDVVIGGLFDSYCELEESTVSDEIRVRQTIGSSDSAPSVTHVLRKASDEEIQQFQNDSLRQYGVPGKANTYRICLNLRVANDLYDELVIRIENATVNGREYDDSTRNDFLMAINPVHKLKTLEAALQIERMKFKSDCI